MLFHDVIAGQPREVVPIAQLPFHVAELGIGVDHPDLATIPITFSVDDIADRPVMQSSNGLLVVSFVPPLGSRVDLPEGRAKVIGHEILTSQILVITEDRRRLLVHIDEVPSKPVEPRSRSTQKPKPTPNP